MQTNTFMLSAYFDFLQFDKLSVFAGAGIGFSYMESRVHLDALTFDVDGDKSETDFSWQLELGADYAFTDHFSLYGGLRYVDLGSISVPLKPDFLNGGGGDFKADLRSGEVFAEVKYTF